MERKIKRASILAVVIYIMINSFVWGLMKAYINSYNAVNHEKLVMAQISDKPDGKEIKILGSSFMISEKIESRNDMYTAIISLIPIKIRSVAEIFKQIGLDTVQEVFQ